MIPREIINFEIIRQIGEGRTGRVFLARNKSTHQFVAIKMLHPHIASDTAFRERLRNEAINLSSLEHDNIARFINYIENDEGAFIVMEYLDGTTLEDFILNKNGLIVESRAVPMLHEVLNAVAFAHSRGVVHGGLSLRNIFLTKDGKVKVLNFGVPSILRGSGDGTRGSLQVDTYTSPEVLDASAADKRSDVYSLGIILQEMLTGRSPFNLEAATPAALATAVKSQTPVRLKSVYPYISDSLQGLVDKATAKRAEDRFADAGDMKRALLKAPLDGSAVGQSSADIPSQKNHGGNSVGSQADYAYSSASGKGGLKPWQTIMIIAGVILLLVGGGFWLWSFLSKGKSARYDYYTDVNGVPGGIQPTDGDGIHYEFTTTGDRVDEIRLVNADGTIVDEADSVYSVFRPVNVKYTYGSNGELESKKVMDKAGQGLYTISYSQGMTRATIAYARPQSSAITRFRLIYNSDDRLIKEEFLDAEDNVAVREDGVAGHRYEYDGKGRLSRVMNVDKNNTTVANSDGVATILFEYTSEGHDVRSVYYDAKGIVITPQAGDRDGGGLQPVGTSFKK